MAENIKYSDLILASSSPYRKELLDRLRLHFRSISPDIDESRQKDEMPEALVARLAEEKAREIAKDHPEALIIGSDQVAVLGDQILGKPGSMERACQQLVDASGHKVTFLTGLCLLNSQTDQAQIKVIPYSVYFRSLTKEQIENYVALEQPLNCAGSFKSEGLGVALFEKMEGEDPSALIGLPLISLTKMLEKEGLDIF